MSTAAALTPDEVRALPAMVGSKHAFAALAIGETTGYALIESGEFPIQVIRFGRTFRFRKADLLAFLGLSETAAAEVQSPAAPQNDGAPEVQSGAPSEQSAPTSASK
ncbi:helix-turn-helix domain-containing protein [Streptomyces griseorubiginosus]|uniref:helix-turn-helix domain-containing protein n=1 Tax=Streptomyces griseorubiginosus TaxID=67304 RepID=UPI00369C1066